MFKERSLTLADKKSFTKRWH